MINVEGLVAVLVMVFVMILIGINWLRREQSMDEHAAKRALEPDLSRIPPIKWNHLVATMNGFSPLARGRVYLQLGGDYWRVSNYTDRSDGLVLMSLADSGQHLIRATDPVWFVPTHSATIVSDADGARYSHTSPWDTMVDERAKSRFDHRFHYEE